MSSKKKPKIVILIPNLGLGGAELFALEIARYINNEFELTIFCEQESKKQYRSDDVDVRYLGKRFYEPYELFKELRKSQVDLVWSHLSWNSEHLKTLSFLKENGFKIILTEHSSFWYPFYIEGCGLIENVRATKSSDIFILSRLDCLVCVSKDTHNSYKSLINNSQYIPNYPNKIFHKKDLKKTYQNLIIGAVSSFHKKVKRLDLLYETYSEVIKSVPNAELHIAGALDPLLDFLYRKSFGLTDKNSKIYLYDFIDDVKSFYESIDILCFTSQLEGMPTVILEASLMEVPTISFDIPGINELILDGESGCVVEFPNTKAMSEIIINLANDKDHITKLGVKAKNYICGNFSIERTGNEYINLLHNILAKANDDVKVENQKDIKSNSLPLQYDQGEHKNHLLFFDRNMPASLRTEWKRTPLISFLIPCYNAKDTIMSTLMSLNYWGFDFDWECIILDDCSTDGTYDFVKSKIQYDRRFRLLRHDRNMGLYQARSTLAADARGYFIINVDSDDTIDPTRVKAYLHKAISLNCDVVDGGLMEITESEKRFHPPYTNFYDREYLTSNENIGAFFTNKIKHTCCGKLYKADVFKKSLEIKNPLEYNNLCEDLIRNSIIFTAKINYSAIDKLPFYNYIRNNNSMSKKYESYEKINDGIIELVNVYTFLSNMLAKKISDYLSEQLSNRLLNDIKWVVSQYFLYQQKHNTSSNKEFRTILLDFKAKVPFLVVNILKITNNYQLCDKIHGQILNHIENTKSTR